MRDVAHLVSHDGLYLLRVEHLQQPTRDDQSRVARIMPKGESVRIAVVNHAETRLRDVALLARARDKGGQLWIELCRVHPFDLVNPLQDEWP